MTRQGSNRFTGSVYEYFRHPSLNTNYWFNKRDGNPRTTSCSLSSASGRAGRSSSRASTTGEASCSSSCTTRSCGCRTTSRACATVFHPRAIDGWFRYNVTVGGQQIVREVNVLDVARASGQLTATDPTVCACCRTSTPRRRRRDGRRVFRPAAEQLLLADAGEADRAPARDPDRLQHR